MFTFAYTKGRLMEITEGINLHHWLALNLACEHIAETTSTCPADIVGYKPSWCSAPCERQISDCWCQYFLDKAEQVDDDFVNERAD